MDAGQLQSMVIVGSGQAGAWAAHTLRAEGFTGRITLVGEERHLPYERPPLSKAILSGDADLASAQVFSHAAFGDLRLDWRPGVAAVSIDTAGKRVALSDQSVISYDKLILCTGGRALRPDIEGVDLPGVFTLRTIEDCFRLKTRLREARTVCVVGGGWIGLEVASTAAALGKAVTVLERGGALCKRVLPPSSSSRLLALHRRQGIDVRLNAHVRSIEPATGGLLVRAEASDVQADVVVVGAGMAANDEIAVRAGLKCDRGIVVDSRCVSSDPDVLAAGDVAVAPNSWAGRSVRLESWENARDQAIVAARVALGREERYDPLPWFWSDQHGTNLQFYGFPAANQRAVTRPLPHASDAQITFLMDAQRVVAAVSVNAPRELRMARRLIERQTDIQDTELEDPTVKLSSL